MLSLSLCDNQYIMPLPQTSKNDDTREDMQLIERWRSWIKPGLGGGGKGGKIERNCGAPSVRGIIRTTDSKRSSDYKLSTVAGGQFTLSAQLIDWTKSSDDVVVQNSVFSLIGCHLHAKIDLRTLESSAGNASEIHYVSRHWINEEIEKLKHLQ